MGGIPLAGLPLSQQSIQGDRSLDRLATVVDHLMQLNFFAKRKIVYHPSVDASTDFCTTSVPTENPACWAIHIGSWRSLRVATALEGEL